MKKILLLIVLLPVLSNCRKQTDDPNSEQKNDTIKPLNYYPIYPGSRWKYVVNDSDTVMSASSLTYLKNSFVELKGFKSPSGEPILGASDMVYVPYLDNKPIFEYQRLEHITMVNNLHTDYYSKWPILSETVGFKFKRSDISTKFGDFNEHVLVERKTINGNNDSIIVLKGQWVYGPNENCKTTEIYTKNIGLTYSLKIDTVKNDTLYEAKLIDYYINK
jgi:hypothetical protein